MNMSRHHWIPLLWVCWAPIGVLGTHAWGNQVSGGGTYFVEPGIRSEFQFNSAHVQCKIGHAVMPDGTTMQMWMQSTKINSVTVDSVAKTAVITGTMISIVQLRFTDGTSATLSETVPFVAFAHDNGTPGAGVDFFSLMVLYADMAVPANPRPAHGLFSLGEGDAQTRGIR